MRRRHRRARMLVRRLVETRLQRYTLAWGDWKRRHVARQVKPSRGLAAVYACSLTLWYRRKPFEYHPPAKFYRKFFFI